MYELDACTVGWAQEVCDGAWPLRTRGRLHDAQRAGHGPDYSASRPGQVQLHHPSAVQILYGGSGGTPLYLSETQSVKNAHIRASPASPQFQRKLEIPLRVVLHALNQLDTKKNQVVILWKSLTIMSPQEVRAFDDQQTACARLFYTTESGQLKGYMELNTELFNALQTTPPEWLMTETSPRSGPMPGTTWSSGYSMRWTSRRSSCLRRPLPFPKEMAKA